ncbi:nucleoid-associated protein [Fusibacter ferrireducens]|uniref:nucleoid-associated protein n=1 Tax=Fusibacter ferrireducens TaxID=2785058 RepID=UPI001A9BE4B5|nr:nucleoid-associated protein [Fusibacter ferrireducens]
MIQVKEIYLHILDGINETKILSENEMGIEGDIQDYIEKHVTVFFEQLDIFRGKVDEASLVKKMLESSGDFKSFSLEIADLFFEVMKRSEEIKPCDLMCLYFDYEGEEYVGILKLNLRTSYIHFVETQDQKITNKIVRQQATLPYKSQKVEEGFLIALERDEVYIKDKQVLLDGNKARYIQEDILKLSMSATAKKTIDAVTKAAEKVVQKYHDQDYVKTAKIKEFINGQLDEKNGIDLESIVYQCFETQPEREAYRQELDSKGIDPSHVEINDSQKKKIKRTQKIKTASGVEITLPYEYVARSENMQIENNPDGSISIKLNNLGELL